MRNYIKLLVVLAVLAMAAVFGASGSPAGAALRTADPAATPTPGAVSTPSELYKTNCSQCHKETGKGGESVVDGKTLDAEDLTSDKMRRRSDAKLFDDIAEGSEDDGMPSFRTKLSEQQIDEIIQYIRVELQHATTK